MPALDEQLARGEFSGLFGWLRTQVHGLGAKVPIQELLKSATGKPLARDLVHPLCRSEVSRDECQQQRGGLKAFKLCLLVRRRWTFR